MKKFELTTESITNEAGKKLFRIKALIDFGDVKAGELGGYVEKEGNVSQDDNAWVSGDAEVFGNAKVSGNALVFGDAKVSGNALVFGDAKVSGRALVFGNARVSGDALISDNADYALVQGFGIKFRCTTFYRGKNKKIMVNCGCFHGDLEEFRKQVKETRSGKIAKEYLMIADLMEYHFVSEDSSDE